LVHFDQTIKKKRVIFLRFSLYNRKYQISEEENLTDCIVFQFFFSDHVMTNLCFFCVVLFIGNIKIAIFLTYAHL
jgi:hypothetical protein